VSNIRVIELRQYLTLEFKARVHGYGKRAAVHDLDGNLLLKLGIGALGQIDLAHPASPKGAQHAVGPYTISHHFWSMHPNRAGLQTGAGLAAECCLRV
jgi:hypothetical protein